MKKLAHYSKAPFRVIRRIHAFVSGKLVNFSGIIKEVTSRPLYKVLAIENHNDEFVAIVQVNSTRSVIHMKPEEILSDDGMTDSFSQRDIRTLTYLGYLGVSSPKYKIIGIRSLNNRLLFVVKEKGKKHVMVKEAHEISADSQFIEKLNQSDAHKIGYTSGMQSVQDEKLDILELMNNSKKCLHNSDDCETHN